MRSATARRPERAASFRDLERARRRALLEEVVTATFPVTGVELRMRERSDARTSFGRHVAMYLAHVGWGIGFSEVGRMFGRDRTTVRYACAVIEDRRDEPRLDRTLDLLAHCLAVGIWRRCYTDDLTAAGHSRRAHTRRNPRSRA
jgi:hypothetical protein